MIFWICILIGGLFVWLAIKIGFYQSLVYMFNIIISIYAGIFVAPVFMEKFPAAGDVRASYALALGFITIGTFMVLYGITYIFLTGHFTIKFPKIFELIFTGALGFFAGFLISSFVALIIALTPLSQNTFISRAGINGQSLQTNISYICRFCDSVNWIVSLPDNDITTEQMINELLNDSRKKEKDVVNVETRQNQPYEPNEPNIVISE